jgi:hypothetical protein
MKFFSRFKKPAEPRWTPAEFWQWFQSDAAQLGLLSLGREQTEESQQAAEAVKIAVQRVHPGLVWGLVPVGDDLSPGRFEVSAGGIRELIPEVEALVAAAPKMPLWVVVGFRQPSTDFCLRLSPDDEGISGTNVTCLTTPQPSGLIDLDVYLPLPPDTQPESLSQIGFIVLDHTLGEYVVMTRIGEIEFHSSIIAPPNAVPIQELAAKLVANPVPEAGAGE